MGRLIVTQTVIEMAEAAEEFIAAMKWSDDTPKSVRSLVAMNVRGFWSYLHSEALEGCQSAVDQAWKSAWHRPDVIRGIPVFVCANEFFEDESVGIAWGPEEVFAVRRDDGTSLELTREEIDAISVRASEEYDPSVGED
jgi:hypothetical protein